MNFFFKCFFVFAMLSLVSMADSIGQGDQSHKVVVGNHPMKGIQIKWLSKDIVANDGVYVYRRNSDATRWERLNSTPLKRITDKTTATPLHNSESLTPWLNTGFETRLWTG